MKKILVLSLIALISSSCASRNSNVRNSVALKVNNETGIACLNAETLKSGDKLHLMSLDCSSIDLNSDIIATCPLVKKGEVEVTKVLNDHYVEFKAEPEVSFEEGSNIQNVK